MKHKYFFPVYFYGLIILVLSVLPTQNMGKIKNMNRLFQFIFSDTFLHFCAFAILMLLLCYAFSKVKLSRFIVLLSAGIALLFGLSIEIIQIFIPYRMFSLKDILIDAAGIGLIGFFVIAAEKSGKIRMSALKD
jgi:VanZ family protein